MKLFLSLVILSSSLWAETFESRVVRVSEDRVYWENGRVTKVDDQELLEELGKNSSLLSVHEDETLTLSIQSLSEASEAQSYDGLNASYEPTILNSEQGALDFFRNARKPSPLQFNVQCYNIAHVRAFEEFKRTGLRSMKIFLFFTDKYIRDYNFKWWFHVTPMTYVRTSQGIEERIIDKEWTKSPVTYKQWTDRFMRNKVNCKQIQLYSHYENHQEDESCYLLPANMYYWQPKGLVDLERTRSERSEFDMDEVRWAYKKDM